MCPNSSPPKPDPKQLFLLAFYTTLLLSRRSLTLVASTVQLTSMAYRRCACTRGDVSEGEPAEGEIKGEVGVLVGSSSITVAPSAMKIALERPLPWGATTALARRNHAACSATSIADVSTSTTRNTSLPLLLPPPPLLLPDDSDDRRAATIASWLRTLRVPRRLSTSTKLLLVLLLLLLLLLLPLLVIAAAAAAAAAVLPISSSTSIVAVVVAAALSSHGCSACRRARVRARGTFPQGSGDGTSSKSAQ